MTKEQRKAIDIPAAHENEKKRWIRGLPRFGRINLRETVLAPQEERKETEEGSQHAGAGLAEDGGPLRCTSNDRKEIAKRKESEGCQEEQDKTPRLQGRAASARSRINHEIPPRYALRQAPVQRALQAERRMQARTLRSPRAGVKLIWGHMICR